MPAGTPLAKPNFPLFGITHVLILLSIPVTAGGLAYWARRGGRAVETGRRLLGGLLLLNELGWYGFKLYKGWFQFPAGLPLQLCDLTLWCTILAAFTRRQAVFEFAFFTGLAGALMAVLTPDLWEPFPSYPTIYFFVAHCGIAATLLYLWWSGAARPRAGCVRRVMLLANGYAVFIGVFNAVFHTNYMYLCRKPRNASLLDYMGPWPVYILTGELVALCLFGLLWAPFRRRGMVS